MGAVIRNGGSAQSHVDIPELFISRQRCPGCHIAHVFGRSFAPGIVSGLALVRQNVESPKLLAGVNVITPDIFGLGMGLEAIVAIALASLASTVAAYDDNVIYDKGSRKTEVSGVVGRMATQPNPAVFAKVTTRLSGLGVNGVQIVAANGNEALIGALGPVSHAASTLSGRFLECR